MMEKISYLNSLLKNKKQEKKICCCVLSKNHFCHFIPYIILMRIITLFTLLETTALIYFEWQGKMGGGEELKNGDDTSDPSHYHHGIHGDHNKQS